MNKFTNVEDYIASFDGITLERLQQMRALVNQELPGADERISYNIPSYFVDGKQIIYFAGFKNHIGMYPGRTNSEAYNKLAEEYAHGKSTTQFSHSEPLPTSVIKKFIKTRLKEVED